jgi:hypothetical protein
MEPLLSTTSLGRTVSRRTVRAVRDIWSRVGPAMGLVYVVLAVAGFAIHGYPANRPSDSELSGWIASTDLNRFAAGVYLEALAYVLFIPFVAWLYAMLRAADTASRWLAAIVLAAGAGFVILTLPINEQWLGMLEQAKKGLDIRASATVAFSNQASFEMTSIIFGLFFLATGLAILRSGAMSRWAGWAAVLLGVVGMLPIIGTAAQFVGILWILPVSIYYTVRPRPTV